MEEIAAVFGINWKLLLIQSVNFGLLLLILWKFLYGPLVRVMGERQKLIENGVRDADEAEKKLAAITDEKSTIITSATLEGEKIVDKARETAKQKEIDMMKDANEKTERVVADAALKAEEIKRLAHEESKSEVARVAVLAAEKILREKV